MAKSFMCISGGRISGGAGRSLRCQADNVAKQLIRLLRQLAKINAIQIELFQIERTALVQLGHLLVQLHNQLIESVADKVLVRHLLNVVNHLVECVGIVLEEAKKVFQILLAALTLHEPEFLNELPQGLVQIRPQLVNKLLILFMKQTHHLTMF